MTRLKFHCSSFVTVSWSSCGHIYTFFSPFPLTETLQEKNFTLHFTLPSFFQVCCQMQLSFEEKSVGIGLFLQKLCGHLVRDAIKEGKKKKRDLWLCHSNYFFTNNVRLLNHITGQFLFLVIFYCDEFTGFLDFLFTVRFTCVTDLYLFPQGFIRHTCNFLSLFSLYVYRKSFLYRVYFFRKFSLDQLYSISHVQFIYIVFYLNK